MPHISATREMSPFCYEVQGCSSPGTFSAIVQVRVCGNTNEYNVLSQVVTKWLPITSYLANVMLMRVLGKLSCTELSFLPLPFFSYSSLLASFLSSPPVFLRSLVGSGSPPCPLEAHFFHNSPFIFHKPTAYYDSSITTLGITR